MSISVHCSHCGAINKAKDSLAGKRIRCPQCSKAITVPAADQPVEAVAVEAVPVAAEPVEAVAVAAEPPALPVEAVPAAPISAAVDDLDEEPIQFKRSREEDELDMTPMVDVTFLLLIFFMVTASFSLQKAISMPKEKSDQPSTNTTDEPEEEQEMVEVQIDRFGNFTVYLGDDLLGSNPGKQNLLRLLSAREVVDQGIQKMSIRVQEDCKLKFLVDAMDAGTIRGCTDIEVTEVEYLE